MHICTHEYVFWTGLLINLFEYCRLTTVDKGMLYITEVRITFGFIVNDVYNNKIIIIFIEGYTVS
jgi:hypothetical protein